MPVIMVSSLTEPGADITFDALATGAVDYLPKPKIDVAASLAEYRDELVATVKAATARVRAADTAMAAPIGARAGHFRTTDSIIAIGASTIAQDEATSVVWGMPGEAHAIGAATLPLRAIAGAVRALTDANPAARVGDRLV